ncbi:DnaJ domain-containing protein [Alloalcanivorax xenomutans]|uniref:DnaJ domain-containing protein n=1 Tax=Alloalcanivorax xenomutans TaxID=1094342 RepID=UPI003C4AF402
MTTAAYPLHWPDSWPRTPRHRVDRSRFKVSPNAARENMLDEIQRLVGRDRYRRDGVIISTNMRLRQDGEPYTRQGSVEDCGVAVYFQYRGRPMVFACDRWDRIHDNMQSIAKTIEALRGIERWGASDMMERAFTGFQALPSTASAWWMVLQVDHNASPEQVRSAYLRARKESHPDHGGTTAKFRAVQQAWEQYQEALNG